MTEQEYRQHPAISRSELYRMKDSPEKFKYFKDNPKEPTPALVFGQLFHKMALEPETLLDEFAIEPVLNKRTKEGKELYAAFLEKNAGKTTVSVEMFEQSKAMCESLMKNPLVKKLLSGEHEVPYFWTDEETGEECKCRADCVTDVGDLSAIVDLKSTQNAETEAFMKSATNYGYDFQSGFYSEGINICRGKKHEFVFIAVEKEPPYAVNILKANEMFINYGNKMFHDFLNTYHECKQTDNWYGYTGKENRINNLKLPAWLAQED